MPRYILLATSAFIFSVSSAGYAYDLADLQKLEATGSCVGCDLSGANLISRSYNNADLRWSNLKGANLSFSFFDQADLSGADLTGARLDRTSFKGATLQGAQLLNVNFNDTVLSGADMRWSKMQHLDLNMDLRFIDLNGVKMEGATFKGGKKCGDFPATGRCMPR